MLFLRLKKDGLFVCVTYFALFRTEQNSKTNTTVVTISSHKHIVNTASARVHCRQIRHQLVSVESDMRKSIA